ncbi:hypothetical protein [Streptomyces sp. MK7]|uniref:hypothetical protein n=1 Tax=Streptomyces sp. MK7 TaxID=3067635 RepID=UPI00292D7295|nr:hypothetical protein [Streptomyces sp. MK7]
MPVARRTAGRGGLRELLSGRYRRRALVVGALWFAGYFVDYGAVYADGALGTVFVTLAVVALARSVTAAAGAEETSGQRLEDVAP